MESTRVFVRNLPPNITADEFTRHFSRNMDITDARLIPGRRIGYVGYKTATDAVEAVKYYNKSFIRMSRIGVEPARSPHEIDAHRGLKAQREIRESFPSTSQELTTEEDDGKRKRRKLGDNEETRLREYLRVMQPPAKASRIISEETTAPQKGTGPNPIEVNHLSTEAHSDDEYVSLQDKDKTETIVEPVALKENPDYSTTNVPNSPTQSRQTAALVREEQTADPSKIAPSDEDWIRSRTSRTLDLVVDDNDLVAKYGPVSTAESSSETQPSKMPDVGILIDEAKQKEDEGGVGPSKQVQENIPTGRLFVRNLSFKITEEEVRQFFETHNYGLIEEVHMPVDYRSGSGKGYAYVHYEDPLAAQHALVELDGTTLQGRLLHIMRASSKRQSGVDEFAASQLPLKKQQQLKKRNEAASSTFNWNSMFMNTDAIMSSISDRFGIAKSELLDPTSSDAAVKQAHAETHVIQETKAYFSANGVDLDAFKRKDRADTALLVKNFPYESKAEDLRAMFSAYGNISKLLVPPSGTIAIIEFESPDHARSAFKGLAYKKIKDSILFLEKAPRNLFAGGSPHQADETVVKVPGADLMEAGSEPLGNTSTLFVRNLNFTTTTERLRETFAPTEGLLSARVKTKPDPKKAGQILSMGFGFLEFCTKQQAQAALAAMDGYTLDGHQLLIRSSHKTINAAEERKKEDQAKKSQGRKTKIIIKNLPFEASKKDVRSLFGPYGQLRSVRVPKKFNMSTRGFAFAEFVTPKEAENAMVALKETHLLGRRLVLEFAAEDATDPEQEIANMQKKVGRQADKVALQQLTGTGRKKFNVGEADESG